jgi:hypothetical protein
MIWGQCGARHKHITRLHAPGASQILRPHTCQKRVEAHQEKGRMVSAGSVHSGTVQLSLTTLLRVHGTATGTPSTTGLFKRAEASIYHGRMHTIQMKLAVWPVNGSAGCTSSLCTAQQAAHYSRRWGQAYQHSQRQPTAPSLPSLKVQ